METIHTITTDSADAPFPTMNWGAIVAGWAIALGIGVLLHLGGLALGLASIHAHSDAGTAKAIGVGAGIWILLTWAGALFVGGMFASWFDGKDDTTMGAMHGLSVWGLSIAVTVILLALGSHPMRGGPMGDAMKAPMHGAMMTARGGQVAADMAVLHAQLARAVVRGGGDATSPSGMAPDGGDSGFDASAEAPMPRRAGRMRDGDALLPVEMALVHDDVATARALLAARPGMSDAQADRVLQAVAPQAARTRDDAKKAAADAAHHAASVAAVGFLAALFSLLTALLGGWVGANHVHKVYHLRTYRRVDRTTPLA